MKFYKENLYFSQASKIKSVNLTSKKQVFTEKDVDFIINSKSKSSIDDFDVSDKYLVTNNQDEDLYFIVDLTRKDYVTTEKVSNLYGQVIINDTFTKEETETDLKELNNNENFIDIDSFVKSFDKTSIKNKKSNSNQQSLLQSYAILISFEGRLQKYNLKKRLFSKTEKNINDYLSKEYNSQYNTNPPYISSYFYDSLNNKLALGLMNGILMTFKANSLKKETIKTINNGYSLIKITSFGMNSRHFLTIGKDNHICIVEDYINKKLVIDLCKLYGVEGKDSLNITPIDCISIGNRIVLSDKLQDSIKIINVKEN